MLVEPRSTHRETYDWAAANWRSLQLLLTFDATLLQLPVARPLLFGTSWIPREIALAPPASKPGLGRANVSFLCGTKLVTTGHKLRRSIYFHQQGLEGSTARHLAFFRSSQDGLLKEVCRRGNPLLGVSKADLHLPFQYSIIVENSDEENYFSEKLLDCLLCRTVPIYWGCRNIDRWFNCRGIIRLHGDESAVARQLEAILRECTAERWNALRDVIEENHKKALEFAYTFDDRLRGALEEWVASRSQCESPRSPT